MCHKIRFDVKHVNPVRDLNTNDVIKEDLVGCITWTIFFMAVPYLPQIIYVYYQYVLRNMTAQLSGTVKVSFNFIIAIIILRFITPFGLYNILCDCHL